MSEINTNDLQRVDMIAMQRDTWEQPLEFRDDSDALVDVSGVTMHMRGKNGEESFELSTLNGGIVHVSLGVVKIVKTASTMKVGKYNYDLVLTFPGGGVRTYMFGEITVNRNI